MKKLNLYVAYKYDGTPLDGILARSEESAMVYWQGKEIAYNSIKCFDSESKEYDGLFIIPIFSTEEIDVDALSWNRVGRKSGQKITKIIKK